MARLLDATTLRWPALTLADLFATARLSPVPGRALYERLIGVEIMTEHQTSENERNVSCSKCAWIGRDNEPYEASWENLDCGVILCPVGCCPQCGEFVYYNHEKTEWLVAHAAPDLLAALEDLVTWLDTAAGYPRRRGSQARAAIAKARQ